MTVTELYDKLASKEFQDPANSDLFYNFFIFQYPADTEAAIRRDIVEFKENLVRPVNYIDVLTIDIFEEFCKYLDQRSFGKNPCSAMPLPSNSIIPIGTSRSSALYMFIAVK